MIMKINHRDIDACDLVLRTATTKNHEDFRNVPVPISQLQTRLSSELQRPISKQYATRLVSHLVERGWAAKLPGDSEEWVWIGRSLAA